MPKETKRSSRIRRVGLGVLILGVLGFAYPTLYYRTTTLTVGKPYLDWYAYREFSSRTHYILFLPMFYWERHYDRGNPGYTLLAKIATK
jgi:hypothetical protein